MTSRPFCLVRRLVLLGFAGSLPCGVALAEPPREPAPPPRPRPVVPAPTPPVSGSGVGRGVGWGRGSSGAPWSIDMVVTSGSGSSCGTIEYPSLGCGGYLRACSTTRGELRIVEYYTHNPGTCAPAGTIVARCTGDTMQWRWDGMETVTTTLRRR